MSGLINSAIQMGKIFCSEFTRTSPKGTILYRAPLLERLSYLWQGYYTTQEQNLPKLDSLPSVFVWPFLSYPRKLNPLMMGSDTGMEPLHCSKNPVIVRIASRQIPFWSSPFLFPRFYPKKAEIVILGAWRLNPNYVKCRTPTLGTRISFAFSRALEAVDTTSRRSPGEKADS